MAAGYGKRKAKIMKEGDNGVASMHQKAARRASSIIA